ncbi:hypothetical protein [Pararhizobium sp. LjRoot238]|uniref:hypothetical protein n=1 Tax=Pararhizobium sp. LjRoot238 TaxID=3342293 RepID=UPI003ECEE14F
MTGNHQWRSAYQIGTTHCPEKDRLPQTGIGYRRVNAHLQFIAEKRHFGLKFAALQ